MAQPVTPVVVTPAKPTLATEAVTALDRALLAALGAFTGAMTLTTGDDMKALAAAGIAAGTAALVSLGNSIRTLTSAT